MRSKGSRGKGESGVSLIEASIVLSVFAILTAMLAPSIGGYISDAQQAAAKKDIEVIGSAVTRMLTDVGDAWILRDGNGGAATAPPSHAAANRVDLLVGSGAVPTVTVARSTAGADWDDPVDNAAVQRLEYFLVQNTPSNLAANAYRTAASMSVVDRVRSRQRRALQRRACVARLVSARTHRSRSLGHALRRERGVSRPRARCRTVGQRERCVRDFGRRRSRRRHAVRCRWCNRGQQRSDLCGVWRQSIGGV